MKKALPTLGVLGLYTGIYLKSFSEIHETLDHFYPGIMTIDCAMMMPTGSKEVLRQVPAVAEIPQPTDWKAGYAEYARLGLEKFGPTIELDGPHGTGNPDMMEKVGGDRRRRRGNKEMNPGTERPKFKLDDFQKMVLENQARENPTCSTCLDYLNRGVYFSPRHKASSLCRSGRRNHCSCSTCF